MGHPASLLASAFPQIPRPECGVVGIGVDLVELREMAELSPTSHDTLYRRCFSDAEIAYCTRMPLPLRHFAARFAAKEAGVKALAGVCQIGIWELEVVRGPDSAPRLMLRKPTVPAIAAQMAGIDLHVSLTHSTEWAAAIVVATAR